MWATVQDVQCSTGQARTAENSQTSGRAVSECKGKERRGGRLVLSLWARTRAIQVPPRPISKHQIHDDSDEIFGLQAPPPSAHLRSVSISASVLLL